MGSDLKLAFIGLGVMGGPMAAHLVRAGYEVTAFNRTQAREAAWRNGLVGEGFSPKVSQQRAGLVAEADIAFLCVGNDDDVREVLLSDGGALAAMKSGSLMVDHTTTSADLARELYNHAGKRGVAFLDAPVSGGQAGAENGTLAVMCGGSDEAFARAEPVMQAYAKRIVHVGAAGAGQTAKMANQMCIAGVLGGLSEAIRLVQGAGLNQAKVLEAISGGAAQSWQMENRWATMVAGTFDFGFAIDWMRKDLAYALAEADRLGLDSPVTAMVDTFYSEIQADGGGRLDTSALIARLPQATQPKV